jgi:hypothetical protein
VSNSAQFRRCCSRATAHCTASPSHVKPAWHVPPNELSEPSPHGGVVHVPPVPDPEPPQTGDVGFDAQKVPAGWLTVLVPVTFPAPSRVVVVVVHVLPVQCVDVEVLPVLVPDPFAVVVVCWGVLPVDHVQGTQTELPLTAPGHKPTPQRVGSPLGWLAEGVGGVGALAAVSAGVAEHVAPVYRMFCPGVSQYRVPPYSTQTVPPPCAMQPGALSGNCG